MGAEIAAAGTTSSARPYLGHAVVDGNIRFLSVSQIVVFDPAQEGGCNRRWAFRYVFGKKEPSTPAQLAGQEYARQLEHYLKTGEDILQPVLRAAKHFFPRPGPDLEVERELGDIATAMKLREALLRPENASGRDMIAAEIRRVAGLTAAGIPLIGAADFRHRRGEYIDSDGMVRREDPGMRVVETADLKTTARIDAHISHGGHQYPGYAKTTEEILAHPQMVGYGVHGHNIYPDATHARLSHIYAQTKNGLAGAKRTGLLPVEEVLRRWERVEAVAREMEQVARAKEPKHVPPNLKSCNAFHRECPHAGYCVRPKGDVIDLFAIGSRGETTMTLSLFDMVKSNGVSTTTAPSSSPVPEVHTTAPMGLFAQAEAVAVPPLPVSPPLPDAEWQAKKDAERARLLAEDAVSKSAAARHPLEGLEGYAVGQNCAGNGYYANRNGQGFIPVEPGHACATCAPALPRIDAINPLDAPPVDPIAEADPLPPEVIATIENPELRQRAEEHARAHAARRLEAAQSSGKEGKVSGRCPAGHQRVVLAEGQDKRKYTCPVCGKRLGIKPSADGKEATLPGHLMPRTEDTTMTAAAPSASTSTVAGVAPPLPPATTAIPPLPPGIVPPPIPSLTVVPPLPPTAMVKKDLAAEIADQQPIEKIDFGKEAYRQYLRENYQASIAASLMEIVVRLRSGSAAR